MDFPFLRALPCVPAVAAVTGLWLLHGRDRQKITRAMLWGTQGLVAVLLIYVSAVQLTAAGALQDSVGPWLGVADLFVAIAFHFDQDTAWALWVVWLATVTVLWTRRGFSRDQRLSATTMAVQAAAFATLMFDSLPTMLSSWALVALCCEACEQLEHQNTNDLRLWRFALHRSSDALGLWAILALFAAQPANGLAELQAALSLQAAPTPSFVFACLVAAVGLRVVATFLTVSWRPHCVPQAMVVIFCGVQLVWRSVGALAAPAAHAPWRLGLTASLLAGVFIVWQLRSQGPFCRWVLSPLKLALTLGARAVVALEAWILDGLFLHAPVVMINAAARLLRLVQGGDAQRYVAIGLLGFGALIYVATRPAAAPALSVSTDGLTVRVDASRGAVSAQRLEFDYDFDGDQVVDRRAAGPHAAYTYAVGGTYKLTVIVRDPFWQTQRQLRELVEVKP